MTPEQAKYAHKLAIKIDDYRSILERLKQGLAYIENAPPKLGEDNSVYFRVDMSSAEVNGFFDPIRELWKKHSIDVDDKHMLYTRLLIAHIAVYREQIQDFETKISRWEVELEAL